jgi:hypothetical protein
MRAVNWPQPAKPAANPCGIVARFFCAGDYEAACILPKGHAGLHDDGITRSKPEPCYACGAGQFTPAHMPAGNFNGGHDYLPKSTGEAERGGQP